MMEHELIRKLENHQSRWIYTLIEAFPEVLFNEHVIVAGGFMRRLLTNADMCGTDVDIFLSPKAPMGIVQELAEGLVSPAHSPNNRTLKGAIRAFPGCVACTVIKDSPYTEVEDLLNSFSLTACQFAMQGDHVYYTVQGFKDAKRKIMRKVPTATWHMKNLVDKYTHNYGFKPVGELKKRIDSGETINANEQIDS